MHCIRGTASRVGENSDLTNDPLSQGKSGYWKITKVTGDLVVTINTAVK